MKCSKAEIGLCVFFDDVLCSFRRTKGYYIMARCLKCKHYLRFLREMAEEEEEFWEWEGKVRRGEIPFG